LYNKFFKLRFGKEFNKKVLDKVLGFIEISLVFDFKNLNLKIYSVDKNLLNWVISFFFVVDSPGF